MAYDSWLTPTPLSGNGNGTITNTAQTHTGRVARTTIVTVSPSVGDAKTYTVNQTAAPEFITVSGTASVGATETQYTVSGQSNTAKINWTVSTPGSLSPTVPSSYTANGASATNNVNIPGDPGARAQFNFSGVVTFTANPTVSTRTGTITLTAGGGGSGLVKTITITQAAGAATISLSPTSGTFTAAGSKNTITVRSNTSWSSNNSGNTWLTTNIPSATGDQSVSIIAAAHTGRAQRAGSIIFTTTNGGSKSATYNATQAAKAEFVSWAQSSYSATKSGGTVTMTGTSNSSKITFSLKSGGSITATIPPTYTANSVSTSNGGVISGDPGSTAQFSFSIGIVIPPNLTIDAKSCVIVATPNSGTAVEATINQSTGDVTLDVSPTTITLPASGTASGDDGKVNVTSNTSWTVS
jgi:hypothetical protein|nr:MAG TPA: cellulase [Crassvirales sp.]